MLTGIAFPANAYLQLSSGVPHKHLLWKYAV
jgi:hypothetical protein